MSEQAETALARLEEVADEAASLEPAEELSVLDSMITRLQARQATALRRFEADGGLTGSGCKTIGSWARLYLRRNISAHRMVQRAKWLPDLPGFAGAYASGEVTDEHVDTLLRWVKPCGGIDVVHAHESALLELARSAPPRQLGEALEVLADLANADRDADRVAALADRSFKCTKVGELVHVDAMVEPALGEALKTAVEAGSRRPTGPDAVDDGRTLMQRRADAFGEIVLRGIDPQAEHRAGRLRAQIAVTTALDALRGITNAPRPLLEHFGVLPMATAHRLMCDGDIARVILDTATGKPLDVGRNSRLAKKRQRRALKAVFKECAFPGCSVPFRFCEIHHLDWWCRGGDTDIHLLVPYCWTHHHFLHEYGFTAQKEAVDGGVRLVHRRPDGIVLADPDDSLRVMVEQLRLDYADDDDRVAEGRDPPHAA